jgi:hypothetical protein
MIADKMQMYSLGFYAVLCNLNLKDTLKRQKTLHTGKLMREIEEMRETLTNKVRFNPKLKDAATDYMDAARTDF